MSASSRTRSYANELRITRFLAGNGLLGDETGQCEILSCFRLAWHKSKYCEGHFRYGTPWNSGLYQDNAGLQPAFEKQWAYSLAFEKVINDKVDIANGKMPGATLICLDIEFSTVSRKVFEVGVCDYVSGKKLIEVCIEHDCSDSELHTPPPSKLRPVHHLEKGISMNTSANVYGPDRRKCTNLLDVHDIATQFRECGITPVYNSNLARTQDGSGLTARILGRSRL